jgi:lysophospholipase L1-like esterase
VEDTYWMRLIRATGMTLGINESWRGTYVSGSNHALSSQIRIGHLGLNGIPDVILVYGGTNDAGGGITIGTFNTENPQNYTDEQIASLPVTTFADAYRTMLIRLMKTYPLAEIVVILPTFTTSYYTITNLDLYVELIKEACDFFGIKYIDARCTGINVYNRATYLVDGIHPNAEGMRLLYEKIYRQLIYT